MHAHDTNRAPSGATPEGDVDPTRREREAPGDEAPAGTESTAPVVCPRCGGSGETDGRECPACGGTGRVNEAVGGG